MSNQIYLRKVYKDQFTNDMGAVMMLSMFYGLEMASSLNWSVEQRWGELSRAQAMIMAGESIMLVADNSSGMPIGILVYTQTDNKNIRRIDSLFVAERFRNQGAAKKLMEAAKEEKEFHTYATPSSVSWYKHNGFKELGKHDEGTIEMTTSNEIPKYSFKIKVPLPTQFDKEFIEKMKALESTLKI